MRPALLAVILLALLVPPARGETPVEAARALVARYHEDRAVLDRARDVLEAALQRERQVETLVALSYVYFLQGDVRATTTEAKLAAYDAEHPLKNITEGVKDSAEGVTKLTARIPYQG